MTRINLNSPFRLEPPSEPEDGDLYLDPDEDMVFVYIYGEWIPISEPRLLPDPLQQITEEAMKVHTLTIRRFECRNNSSNKFWEIEIEQPDFKYRTRWGPINGNTPRVSGWTFSNQREVDRLIRAKIRKGYSEVLNTEEKDVIARLPKKKKHSPEELEFLKRKRDPLYLF